MYHSKYVHRMSEQGYLLVKSLCRGMETLQRKGDII